MSDTPHSAWSASRGAYSSWRVSSSLSGFWPKDGALLSKSDRTGKVVLVEFQQESADYGLSTQAPGRRMTKREGQDLIRGTLDLLILKTLSLEPMHGWGINQRIQQLSKGILEVNQGSLYPALQRLEYRGLVSTSWGTTDQRRRAKYYRLTRDGRDALGAEVRSWRRYVGVVDGILEAT